KSEQLRHTFLHKLEQSLLQLLRLHPVEVDDLFEYFGRKAGYAGIGQALPLRQRVTDLEVSGVVDSHDISGPRFIYCLAVLRHKGGRIGESERPILPYMEIVAAAFELSRTHTHKRDPVSVLWVHVGVYLENKAGEPSFLWGDDARSGGPRLWRRRNSYERIEQFFHAEVVHGATKEHRCHFPGAIVVHGKLRIHRFDQFHVSP